jgi:hypothetical protein
MLATIQYRNPRLLPQNVKIRICNTIILPVVLYGCGTWSLILREEHRLRVFENRVLRRKCGPKRDEVTGGWRKLLRDLYSSPSVIRMTKSKRMKRILVERPEGKRLLGRPGHRYVNIIKMDLREIGWGGMD